MIILKKIKRHGGTRKQYQLVLDGIRRLLLLLIFLASLVGLQPAVTVQAASVSLVTTGDTYIRSTSATNNCGGAVTVSLSPNSAGHRISLYKWDLSSIPSNATVSAVSISFYVITGSTVTAWPIYDLKRTWVEGTANCAVSTTSANFNTTDGVTTWGTAGAKNTNTDRGNTNLWNYVASDFGGTGNQTFNLNSSGVGVVQGWVTNASTNFGLTMQFYTGTTSAYWDVASKENVLGYTKPTLNVTYTIPTMPLVSVSGTLSAFNTAAGSPSAEQSYTVSGSNLTNDIVITPPADFEVSTSSGSGFVTNPGSLTLTQSGGTVGATTIYVRLNPAGAAAYSANIANASTGAGTQNVAVSGSSLPSITVSSTMSAFASAVGVYSGEKTYTVSALNLTGNLVIAPPADFEVSTSSGSGFVANPGSLTLSPGAYGAIGTTTIYVRFIRGNAGASSGNINHDSTGATQRMVAVSGTASDPTITVTGSLSAFAGTPGVPSAEQSYTVAGSFLAGNISINAPADFEISTTSGSGFGSSLLLTQSSGSVSTTTIYARFNRSSTGPSSGSITHTSSGAVTQNQAVSGNAADWVSAFNDAASPYVAGNATTFGITGTTSGILKNYSTGALTGVTATFTTNGSLSTTTSGNNATSGDAFGVFNGKVDTQGVIACVTSCTSSWWIDVSFTGLDPTRTYTFATTTTRNGGASYNDRNSLFTISDIISATNASSSGVNVISNESVWFNTGNNLAEGYVARWNAIQPGPDGDFTVRAQGYGTNYAGYGQSVFSLGLEPTTPLVLVSGTLSAFNTAAGSPSAEQSYTVSGSNLTNDIVITPPADFEVSTSSGSGFVTNPGSLTLTQSGGTVGATTIYVRLNPAGAAAYSANIANASTGAGTQNVAVSGSSLPSITVSSTMSAFASAVGVYSGEKTYTVSALNLTGNLVIAPPADFEVSTSSGSGFVANPGSLTLSPGAYGAIGTTTIYVRFIRGNAGASGGNINHDSTGATQRMVAVSGTASDPTLSMTGSLTIFTNSAGAASATQTLTVSGNYLAGNVLVTAPTDFEVSTSSGSGFGPTVTLIPAGGSLSSTSVYLRLNRGTAGNSSGNVSAASSGAMTQTLAANGTTYVWIAFNDAASPYKAPDTTITKFGLGSSSSGLLVDYVTGTPTSITATFTSNGNLTTQTSGAAANAGTDVFNTFGSKLDTSGIIGCATNFSCTNMDNWIDVTFTGLDPARTYTFATTTVRDGGFSTRETLFTILDITTATNASTSGVNVINNESVWFPTGTNKAEGYLARWTNIQPGADGDFTIRTEKHNSSEFQFYGQSVFMLAEEASVPPAVTGFTVPALTNSLNIPISTFTASDDVEVTGFLVTTTASVPGIGDPGWNPVAPTSFTVGGDGVYKLYPWAKDGAGNVSAVFSPASEVEVDTLAPDTQIDGHPADPSGSANASFSFSSSDLTAFFECSLDYDPFSGCSVPAQYSGLGEGDHTFAVRARDLAGNADLSPAEFSWKIDTHGPMLTIIGFDADGIPMGIGGGGGYILPTTNHPEINHQIQFAVGSVSNESLDGMAGLYLDPTGVDVAGLTAYYKTRIPDGAPAEMLAYRAYLISALDGVTHPFAYLSTDGSNNLVLHDAAQYDLAGTLTLGMVVPDDYPLGTYVVNGTIHDSLGNGTPLTFKLIVTGDRVSPILTITGFNADGTLMALGGGGYILPTTNHAAINHEIQFAPGSFSSEPLDGMAGLFLDPTGVDVPALTTYYTARIPDGSPVEMLAYRAYLIAALDGVTHPFAYLSSDGSNNLVLHDAAQYDLAGALTVGMVVPDDYPLGTYVVNGSAKDLAGNSTPLTLTLIVSGDRVAPILTISGFTADSIPMPVAGSGGYILQAASNPALNHEIQFNTGSFSSEAFNGVTGLYLDPAGVDVAGLTAYYIARIPDGSPFEMLAYRAYLIAALDGVTHPFAYISTDGSNNLVLHDAAQYDLAGALTLGMIIPDDYPSWTYTVHGNASDLAGNSIPVTLKLTVATSHSISLQAGWNLVSFNLHPLNTAIGEVLSSLDSNFILVYGWDSSGNHSANGNWMKYSPTGPGYANTLNDLDESMGFWINMSTPAVLTVWGVPPVSTTIALSDNAGGWNLVGYPSGSNGSLPAIMQAHGLGTNFSLVYTFHASDGADPWKLFDRIAPGFANDLTELAPGWGYWVKMTGDLSWQVDH